MLPVWIQVGPHLHISIVTPSDLHPATVTSASSSISSSVAIPTISSNQDTITIKYKPKIIKANLHVHQTIRLILLRNPLHPDTTLTIWISCGSSCVSHCSSGQLDCEICCFARVWQEGQPNSIQNVSISKCAAHKMPCEC